MCLDESIEHNREGEILGCDRKLDELLARHQMELDRQQKELDRQLKELDRHQKELEAADTRAREAEKLMQELERESVTEFQELRKASAAEASAKVTRLLNEQLRGHKAEVDFLAAQLASERALGQEAASKAQNLAYASVDLKNSVDDLQQQKSQLLEDAALRDTRFQEAIDLKDLEIQQTHQRLEESLKFAADSKAKLHAAADRENSLNREIHDRLLQVEKIMSAADDQISQFDKNMTSCIQKINELEAQVAHASDLRQQSDRDRLQEVNNMQTVIEALQDRIQQTHEAKETELESQRLHLTQEHDDCMLKAREAHEKDLQSEKENSRENFEMLEVARDVLISDLEGQRNNYEIVIDDLHQRLDEAEDKLQESRPVLEEAQGLLDLTRERCSKAESSLQTAIARENEKADIITAKDVELARVYRQRNAERASLVAANKIVGAINIQLEIVAIDEATSAGSSTSQSLTDSASAPPSSDSTNPFIDQILDQIKTHNPQATPEKINAIAANLLSKYRMGQNGELEASNEELSSMLQFDLKALDARCRDLTDRFKSTESSEIKNADTAKEQLGLLQEYVRRLEAEKADLQEQLAEADGLAPDYEERKRATGSGTVRRLVTFTKDVMDDIRERQLQKDDEDDKPRFEHIEVCTVLSKQSQLRVLSHEGMNFQMTKANESGFHIVCGSVYHGQCKQFYPFDICVGSFQKMLNDVAQVAGMQEQLRAIENSNENLIEDQQR